MKTYNSKVLMFRVLTLAESFLEFEQLFNKVCSTSGQPCYLKCDLAKTKPPQKIKHGMVKEVERRRDGKDNIELQRVDSTRV